MNSTPVYVLNSIFKSIATLVIMFLILLITLSAAKAFSSPVAKAYSPPASTKVPKARYVDGYYSCETRTNEAKEKSVFELGPSFEKAKANSFAKCEESYGRGKCYPYSFCYAISGNVPVKCTVVVGSDEYLGRGVDWETAENNARLQCALGLPFSVCLNAFPGTCVRSDAGVMR